MGVCHRAQEPTESTPKGQRGNNLNKISKAVFDDNPKCKINMQMWIVVHLE